MGVLILVLVLVFHGVVFCGLAYWINSTGKLNSTPPAAAGGFTVGAVLANIVLCLMLLEIYSGINLVSGQMLEDNFFSTSLVRLVYAQPVFAVILYFLILNILKAQNKSPAIEPGP